MGRRPSAEQVAQLEAQAEGTRRAAECVGDFLTQDLTYAAAATIESMARYQKRRLNADKQAVLVLPDNASTNEMREARLRRAVRRGEDVFLPSWRDAAVGIPNVFLRSALFAAAEVSSKPLMNAEIASRGDASITMTGHPLGDYDRRVFAACLDYYRGDRPLDSRDQPRWVKVTFWQLAKDLQVAYGANVHRAIRDSLIRLNAAHLRIRVKSVDIPMPRLMDVVFDDGYKGADTPDRLLRGSDLISFRVQETMANLFGPEDWSAVSKAALHDHSGLPSWLAGFYSSHAEPYAVKIADLYRMSGVVCDLREFRRRLKRALGHLQAEDVSPDVRVAASELEEKHVTVTLVRWIEAA
ncbi:MAG: plasmid replication initiator TrfA [Aromatoleum sp.]|jgi:hypothetical protein|uniref:plasmid replication initiator TrfA n=1 Tax=Aromatoleum sp. TaxID=2307007 RepID=UPI002895E2EE|nr:plasmid replication initiator TrfA [Aromatoleum sp.]MDT3670764.1 plasmid replication initiator TrfA [Aromatoleum sp.]